MQYWPNQQGIELNMQVSKLFQKLYLKFNYNLYNKTDSILSIDIVNVQTKKEIFKIILLELEILVLDIIELDLNLYDLHQLNQKILIDLINKSMANFSFSRISSQDLSYSGELESLKVEGKLLSEHKLLLQNLLTYLIFGSQKSDTKSLIFVNAKTPIKHIEILLDNLVVQLADTIFLEIIKSKQSLSHLFAFLMSQKICNDRYLSTRSIATFRNNLLWSHSINFYIEQPKMIYNNRYQVWLFSKTGLQAQYIYTNREQDLKYLCTTQIIVITLLELQDFIIPKIKNLIFFIGKMSLVILSNIIGHGIHKILQSVILVTQNQQKSS